MKPVPFKTDLYTVSFSRRKLMHQNRSLAVLLGLSDLLSQSGDPAELLNEALDYVLSHTPFDAGRIYLMEPDRSGLELIAYRGMDVVGLERVSLSEGFTGRSARTCSFIAQSVSSLDDARRARLLSSKGLQVIVCVPFVVRNRVEGVMNLASRKSITLEHDQVNLLMMIGHMIGAAVLHLQAEEALRDKIQEIRRKKETMKFLVATISHDLKGPAVGAHGLARRLRDLYESVLDERGKTYCEQIFKALAQITCLVDELNAFIRTREMPLRLQKVSMRSLWETLRHEYSVHLEKRAVQWIETEDAPEVVADEVMLLRAFRNLIQNALNYGGSGLRALRLGCEDAESHYVFWLEDDGEGIALEDQQQLFEPFRRSDASRGVEGSGLGLAVVREVARRHGGEAWVRSRPGEGAVFYFSVSKGIEAESDSASEGG